ncbi:MAG: FAD binding domain-containing protein [Methyloligellaceae bacterium]
MKPAPFTYHNPGSLDELVAIMGSVEDVKVLAGGQSLVPMLNMRYAQPEHIVDLNKITDLSGIEDKGDAVAIGSMTRQSALMKSDVIAAKLPIMIDALQWVGHFQTRARGTIGGSLCHLDPSAELPSICLLYEANLTIHGPEGKRQISMTEWPLAYMMPNLEEKEVLVKIEIPVWSGDYGYGFQEYARRHGDFAIVAAGALLRLDNNIVQDVAIVLAGAQQVPYRLSDAESYLVGKPLDAENLSHVSGIAQEQEAMSDAYIESDYRKRLAGVMTRRALEAAAERAGGATPS